MVFQYAGQGWVLHLRWLSLTTGLLRFTHFFGGEIFVDPSRTHLMIGAWMPPPQVFEQAANFTTFQENFRRLILAGGLGLDSCGAAADPDLRLGLTTSELAVSVNKRIVGKGIELLSWP